VLALTRHPRCPELQELIPASSTRWWTPLQRNDPRSVAASPPTSFQSRVQFGNTDRLRGHYHANSDEQPRAPTSMRCMGWQDGNSSTVVFFISYHRLLRSASIRKAQQIQLPANRRQLTSVVSTRLYANLGPPLNPSGVNIEHQVGAGLLSSDRRPHNRLPASLHPAGKTSCSTLPQDNMAHRICAPG